MNPANPGVSPWSAPASPAPPGKHSVLARLYGRLRRIQFACAFRWTLFCVELWLMSVLAIACAWGVAGLAWEITPATHHAIRDGIAVLLGLSGISALALIVAKVPTKRELGAYLEQFEPGFKGALLTSIEALRPEHRVPRAVLELSAERAERILRLGVGRAAYPRLPWRRVHSGMLGAMAVTLLAVALGGPAFFEAFLRGMFPVAPVVRMLGPRLVEVRPGAAQALEGSVLTIEGRYEGPPADRVWVEFVSEHGDARGLACARAGSDEGLDVWQGGLGPLTYPGKYRVLAQRGAASSEPVVSEWYPIDVLPRSTVQNVTLYVEPPPHTGIAPWKETNPVTVTAPLGSRIILYVTAGPVQDLSAGTAEIPGAKRLELKRLAETELGTWNTARYGAHFSFEQAGVLRVQFDSADAGRPGPSALLTLAVLPDRPPEAEAQVAAGATPTKDGLALDVKLNDDFGLQGGRLLLRPLPPEPGRSAPSAPQVTAVALPLRPGLREWNVRWMLPRAGLEELFRAGFLYQVEAQDNAAPNAQTGRSTWKRWEPNQSGKGAGEQAGLLEQPERRLTRKNALNSVPDLSPDQLGQLGNVGAGKPSNSGTPRPERLEGKKENGADQPGGQIPTPGTPKPGNGERSEYENPYRTQAKPPEGGEKKGPPQGGANGGERGEKNGEGAEGKAKPDAGKGDAQPGGNAKGGDGVGQGSKEGQGSAGNKEGSGATGGAGSKERKQGAGSGATGKQAPGEGATPEPAGGGANGGAEVGREKGGTGKGESPETPPEPGSGTKGNTPIDGGRKTGKETGLSKGEMAPPDLGEVSKMKAATPEEVRAYSGQHSVKGGRTDFGGSESAKPEDGERTSEGAPVNLGKVQISEPDSQREPKTKRLEGAPKARTERIDPVFKPMVDAYLFRLQQLKRASAGGD